MDADEVLGLLRGFRERCDRQRRRVRGEDHVGAHNLLRALGDVRLDRAVLEYGFEHEIAAFERGIIGGGDDARHQRILVGGGCAALADGARDELVDRRHALVGALLIAIDENDVEAVQRADIADARAHEARADNADLLEIGGADVLWSMCALVQFVLREKQRADHRRRLLRAQDMREPARLDGQRLVHRQLQPFIDGVQNGLGGGIIVVGLAAIDGVGGGPDHHAGRREHPAGRSLELLGVPRRLRFAAVDDKGAGALDDLRFRRDFMHELGAERGSRLDLIALEQKLQRVARLHDARHALRAAGARKEPDLDFRQADLWFSRRRP